MSYGVNRSSWSKLFLLQNFMNIDGTTLILFDPSIYKGSFHTFLWKTLSDRNFIWNFIYLQVWDGNEDCEEVEWDECNLVDYQVPFIVPKITCSFGEEIPWMDCVEDTLTQSTCRMTCEPRSAVSCVPQTQEKCITGKI